MTTVTKMRLSKETLSILKNFSSINSNILIQPGNVLKTKSTGNNIYVKATIAETFDVTVPIWDLNKFLGVVSMFVNPDLEFAEDHVVISNGRSSVKYYYSEPSLLSFPERDIKMPKSIIKFYFDDKDLNEVLKAASILQVSDLTFVAESGQFYVNVGDASQSSANNFKIILDENYSGPDFSGTINVSEIKFIPGSYNVELTDTIISKFSHTTLDLAYYISIKKD